MRLVAFLMIVFCITTSLAKAQDNSEAAVQSRIIALEKAWNQAYKAGDIRALDAILDNEIVLINDDYDNAGAAGLQDERPTADADTAEPAGADAR